jgi:hypothetical protein
MIYAVLPPGRVMKLGDCAGSSFVPLTFFPSVAQMAKDGLLQSFFLRYPAEDNPRRDLVSELLSYDSRVELRGPEGVLPLGRAFEQHGRLISSRSSWDPQAPSSVAYGKFGREGHGANDVGQFCLDGFGQPLIVALGSPSGGYPADYFSENREKYYNASTWGQNLFVFDRREQLKKDGKVDIVGKLLHSEFDDKKGAAWQIDLTPVYEDSENVRRTVIHLLPDVAVVLDEAKLKKESDISMRWHTSDRAEPKNDGEFTINNEGVNLAARIVPLDGADVKFQRGEHAYEAPFDMLREGSPLNQPRESFVEVIAKSDRLRLLSLFAVQKTGQPRATWQPSGTGWKIETPEGPVVVTLEAGKLIATNKRTAQSIVVALE